MMEVESYRQFAADCVRQAQTEARQEDKNILLNVALAWLRLAQQTQSMNGTESPATDLDRDGMTSLPPGGEGTAVDAS
jgi:hypothetical protein